MVLKALVVVLEALAVATPRPGRKCVDAVCDRVEAALEDVVDLARQLAGGDEAMSFMRPGPRGVDP